MKKNIAVVGCGHWGKNLVRNFSELGALFSICDPNSEIADLYASQYNVKKTQTVSRWQKLKSSSRIVKKHPKKQGQKKGNERDKQPNFFWQYLVKVKKS